MQRLLLRLLWLWVWGWLSVLLHHRKPKPLQLVGAMAR